MNFHIERYGRTRFFALYCNGSLLCVTAYRKGAIAVRDTIQALLKANAESQARLAELLEGGQDTEHRESSRSSNRGRTYV